MKELMHVTFAPHIKSNMDTFRIMLLVILSLLPSVIISIINYGLHAFYLYIFCIFSAVILEYVFCKIQGKESTINDLSAVLTGLLFALTLPPKLPLWVAFVGIFFAIIVGKMVFGGIGQNPFNPALVGRTVILISFPTFMTSFDNPSYSSIDALSGATMLLDAKDSLLSSGIINNLDIDYFHYMILSSGGSLGEISPIALILAGFFLIYKKIISWHIPVAFITSVFVFTFLLHAIDNNITISPYKHILSGGLLLGAFFMATDYPSSPMFPVSKILFGMGCGILTVSIRVYGGYPEGVGFAILIMNAFTPVLDRFFKPRVFGDRDEQIF